MRLLLLIVRIAAELFRGESLSRLGQSILVLCVVAGVGVGVYGYVSSHAVVSSVFLGIAAFTLVAVVGFLLRAAAVLADEREIVENVQATGRRKKELEREKASLLKALKELEFDHEMGKVSDADFREIGGQYRVRAMRVLRQLDEQGADYMALVEKELKARLGVKKDADGDEKSSKESAKSEEKASSANRDADEKATENKAEEKKKSALMRCGACGTTNDSDAVFCKKCGKKVAA